MIACVSPADDNRHETLSTLRYAGKARKIKNKPIANEDQNAAKIAQLEKENEKLRLELLARHAPEHEVKRISGVLINILEENTSLCERVPMAENASDCMKRKLGELNYKYSQLVDSLQTKLNDGQLNNLKNIQTHIVDLQDVKRRKNVVREEKSGDGRKKWRGKKKVVREEKSGEGRKKW